MVQYGLVEAGYNSIIFDDCVTEKERKRVDSYQVRNCTSYLYAFFTLVNSRRSLQRASWPSERNTKA